MTLEDGLVGIWRRVRPVLTCKAVVYEIENNSVGAIAQVDA